MQILITLLTLVLVVNCLFLILLVLIQLPKKEAGAGLAFGAGATDALFGAGSGNALTKLTKYAAGCFLLLSLGLGVLNAKAARESTSVLRRALASQTNAPVAKPVTAPKPASQFQTIAPSTNLLTMPATAAPTNAAATPSAPASTNTPAPK